MLEIRSPKRFIESACNGARLKRVVIAQAFIFNHCVAMNGAKKSLKNCEKRSSS